MNQRISDYVSAPARCKGRWRLSPGTPGQREMNRRWMGWTQIYELEYENRLILLLNLCPSHPSADLKSKRRCPAAIPG